jgi:hypothetical protein
MLRSLDIVHPSRSTMATLVGAHKRGAADGPVGPARRGVGETSRRLGALGGLWKTREASGGAHGPGSRGWQVARGAARLGWRARVGVPSARHRGATSAGVKPCHYTPV